MTIKQLVVVADHSWPNIAEVVRALAALAARDGAVVLFDGNVHSGRLAEQLCASPAEVVRFVGGRVAAIDPTRCDGCGLCLSACRLCAIQRTDSGIAIDPAICEACQSCYYQCPIHAIDMLERDTGTWTRSTWAMGALFSARLDVGQPDSGKLLNVARLQARTAAMAARPATLIVAAPADQPEAVSSCLFGADLALLLVTSEQDLQGLGAQSAMAATARVRAMALDCASQGLEPLRGQVEAVCRDLSLELAVASPPPHRESTASPAAAQSVWSLSQAWPGIRRRLWVR